MQGNQTSRRRMIRKREEKEGRKKTLDKFTILNGRTDPELVSFDEWDDAKRKRITLLQKGKEHVEEALKMREEAQDTLEEWLSTWDETKVIMAAKRIQEEELESSLCDEGGASDETSRTSERSEKLWSLSTTMIPTATSS